MLEEMKAPAIGLELRLHCQMYLCIARSGDVSFYLMPYSSSEPFRKTFLSLL